MTKKCYFCSYPNRDDALCCLNCGMELRKYWCRKDGRAYLVDERDERI